jgi:hypothetical protein
LAEFVELFIEQGASFNTDVEVSDANGQPKDLREYSVFSQIRKSYYSSTSFDFTIDIPDPLIGAVEMGMSAQLTSSIQPGRYVYDVIIKNNETGEVTRIFEGVATVLPQVTKIEQT